MAPPYTSSLGTSLLCTVTPLFLLSDPRLLRSCRIASAHARTACVLGPHHALLTPPVFCSHAAMPVLFCSRAVTPRASLQRRLACVPLTRLNPPCAPTPHAHACHYFLGPPVPVPPISVPALLCRAHVRPALQRLGPLASAPSAPIRRRMHARAVPAQRPRSRVHTSTPPEPPPRRLVPARLHTCSRARACPCRSPPLNPRCLSPSLLLPQATSARSAAPLALALPRPAPPLILAGPHTARPRPRAAALLRARCPSVSYFARPPLSWAELPPWLLRLRAHAPGPARA
jgi:hypothetical protein